MKKLRRKVRSKTLLNLSCEKKGGIQAGECALNEQEANFQYALRSPALHTVQLLSRLNPLSSKTLPASLLYLLYDLPLFGLIF